MAVTPGEGFSRVLKNRRFEDYRSMKQYFSDRTIYEVIIEGRTTTDGALAEVNFAVGDTINYIGAEGQAYIRIEQVDANQDGKFIYLQYQDDTGAVKDWVTADIGATETDEVAIGSTDFFRARQMYSEVEASANDAIVLTDADMGGANDIYAFIDDGNSQFNLERFFTQPNSVCDSYLAHFHAHSIPVGIGAATDTFLAAFIATPRALNAGEVGAAADKTFEYKFADNLHIDPLILLEGGTEVIFQVGDIATANVVHIESVLLEVYPTNSTPTT